MEYRICHYIEGESTIASGYAIEREFEAYDDNEAKQICRNECWPLTWLQVFDTALGWYPVDITEDDMK